MAMAMAIPVRETGIDEKNVLTAVMSRVISKQTTVVVYSALNSLIRTQTTVYSPSYLLLHYANHAFLHTIMFPNQFNVIEPDFGPLIYLTTGGFYDELFENAWKRRRVAII
jgi:hypothetical protein